MKTPVRVLALIDQAIVSAASFVATVIVARFGGATDLASYSIATSILLLLVGAQNSVVVLPYIIRRRHHEHNSTAHAGSTLVLNLGLAVSAFLILGVVAALLVLADAGDVVWLAFALAFAGPATIAREFARRYAFAHLQIARALEVDIATVVLQLSALFILGRIGWLSAQTAIITFGAACLASAGLGFARTRREFNLHIKGIGADLNESWSHGRWLLVNQVIGNLSGYAPIWLAALILGSTATGILAACTSIVAIANPLIFGLDNILAPRLSDALTSSGSRGLFDETLRSTLIIGAVMIAVVLMIWFGGAALMELFYPAAEFSGTHDILIALALGTAALAFTLPATSALAVTERTRDVVLTGLVALAVMITAMLTLTPQFGIMGIALASLLGNVCCLGLRWALLLRSMNRLAVPRSANGPTGKAMPEPQR